MMFLLSNLYHNVLLNDFDRILFPPAFFYSMLLVAYLGIGFLIIAIYTLTIIKLGPHLSAMVIGALLGLVIYAITISMGFSFNNSLSFQQNLIDLTWQMLEQAIGGLAGAVCYQIIDKGGFYINF